MMQCDNFLYSFTSISLYTYIIALFGRKTINMAMADFLFKVFCILLIELKVRLSRLENQGRDVDIGAFPKLRIENSKRIMPDANTISL